MGNSTNIIQTITNLKKIEQFNVPTIEELAKVTRVVLGVGLSTLLEIINTPITDSTINKEKLMDLKIKAINSAGHIEKILLEREIYYNNSREDWDKIAELPSDYQVGEVINAT